MALGRTKASFNDKGRALRKVVSAGSLDSLSHFGLGLFRPLPSGHTDGLDRTDAGPDV